MFNLVLFYATTTQKNKLINERDNAVRLMRARLNDKKFEPKATVSIKKCLLKSHDIVLLKAAFKHKLPKHILVKMKYKFIVSITWKRDIVNDYTNEKVIHPLNIGLQNDIDMFTHSYSFMSEHLYRKRLTRLEILSTLD